MRLMVVEGKWACKRQIVSISNALVETTLLTGWKSIRPARQPDTVGITPVQLVATIRKDLGRGLKEAPRKGPRPEHDSTVTYVAEG